MNDPGAGQPTLFSPEGEVASEGDNSPIEHAGLPAPVRREKRPPTLVLSVETEEERTALVALLGCRAIRRGTDWECRWPPEAYEDELRLDVEDDAA